MPVAVGSGSNTIIKAAQHGRRPGGDAALLRIKKTGAGIAVCTDGNGRRTFLEPYRVVRRRCVKRRAIFHAWARSRGHHQLPQLRQPRKRTITYQLALLSREWPRRAKRWEPRMISGNVSSTTRALSSPLSDPCCGNARSYG
jgi:hypothetical protein